MYVLKLWGFARLFAAMGVCKSGLSSTQELNSTETLLLDTTRVNMTFSQWVSFNLVSALQFTVQMSKLTDLERLIESVFVAELKTLLTHSQRTRENSHNT